MHRMNGNWSFTKWMNCYLHPLLCLGTPCENLRKKKKERREWKSLHAGALSFWIQVLCYLAELKYLKRGISRKTFSHHHTHILIHSLTYKSHSRRHRSTNTPQKLKCLMHSYKLSKHPWTTIMLPRFCKLTKYSTGDLSGLSSQLYANKQRHKHSILSGFIKHVI